jgi:beta-carotene 15,15'-dioxygenase
MPVVERKRDRRGDSVFLVSAQQVILNIGLIAVVMAIPISFVTKSTTATTDVPGWMIIAAIIAVALGIPHGAVDHLTLGASLTWRTALTLGSVYLVVALMAATAVILFPGIAFIAVLAMTVWHFGAGDVEASRELGGAAPETGSTRILHSIAAGSAPVLLPLTSPAAVTTLYAIQPRLAQVFTPALITGVRVAVLALIVITLLVLIQQGRMRAAIELIALAALGFFVAPLLAFAVYFSFWHSLRHTARLAEFRFGTVRPRSIGRILIQGLPALIGTVLVVAVLVTFASSLSISATWLWFGLALVWGLTVPHMVAVSFFDHRRRRAAAPTGLSPTRSALLG